MKCCRVVVDAVLLSMQCCRCGIVVDVVCVVMDAVLLMQCC